MTRQAICAWFSLHVAPSTPFAPQLLIRILLTIETPFFPAWPLLIDASLDPGDIYQSTALHISRSIAPRLRLILLIGTLPSGTYTHTASIRARQNIYPLSHIRRVSSVNFCGSPASPDTDLHRRQPNSLAHTSSNISLHTLYQHSTPPHSSTLLSPYPNEKSLGLMNGSPRPVGAGGLLPPAPIITTKDVDAAPKFLGMPLKYVSYVLLPHAYPA
jgi:hypothetical protein